MLVPLATFAVPELLDGQQICKLNINSNEQTNSIIIGSMFFSQFAMLAEWDINVTQLNLTLTVNINALDSAYIGNEVRSPGPNPFVAK
jgi:hypothetical protein